MNETPKLLTDAEIAAIADRVEKATVGPWEWKTLNGFHWLASNETTLLEYHATDDGIHGAPEDEMFIAAARQDIPRLLADLQRYREWRRRLVECKDMIELLPLIQEVRAALEESP